MMDQETINKIEYDAMVRMRWRLWFLFAESKYEEFRYKGRPNKPHYQAIKDYCIKQWGKEPKDMSKHELRKVISIVKKWK